MGNLLRYAVQLKEKNLINKLIKFGIYKKNNKHLYELTLSELEKEYKLYMDTNGLVSNLEGR
ncbi:Fur-regulated basic protein FbpA [Bacillus sp. AFS076308]|uniref:Fur-regulated basic protein FbpA n=1 Tax=Bacillus sp. AFS076308 TaxID=2033512 RepID=UPI000BF2CF6C|nr:Fur-regulated basic protein FbpA [Bacillus sp. AFS076308]PFN80585.1 Fur-regulated basic protein FbpA [Bacillus sp. AFS076308]